MLFTLNYSRQQAECALEAEQKNKQTYLTIHCEFVKKKKKATNTITYIAVSRVTQSDT